ncbi:MAG: sigma-70 family RNA polymerase sigma factor [Kiritimatiellae bacterium]|nr:sigma-70 family RNA polymerase sigma factor [Kiritimatiellia bacterium]
MGPEELDSLIRKVQDGENEYFTEIVAAVQKEVRIFLSVHASSVDMVEEVLQAALVTSYENIHKYQLRGTFLSWLKGIAKNLLLKHLRERERYLAVEQHVLEGLLVKSGLESAERADEHRAEAEQRLLVCLEKLPARSRELVRRKYVDRSPLRKLAELFEKSENWVAVTLFRIRETLRQCMMAGAPPPRETP